MNSTSSPIPGPRPLYHLDRIYRSAAFTSFFGLVVAVGMQWASHGVTPPADVAEFEMGFIKWGTAGGLVMAFLSGIVAVRRYLWVTKVLSKGTLVKGIVEKVETWDAGGGKTSSGRPAPNRAHSVTVRYEMHGRDRKVYQRLTHAGSTYGLVKDRETDLMVLDSAPDKPLIRSMYLGKHLLSLTKPRWFW